MSDCKNYTLTFAMRKKHAMLTIKLKIPRERKWKNIISDKKLLIENIINNQTS